MLRNLQRNLGKLCSGITAAALTLGTLPAFPAEAAGTTLTVGKNGTYQTVTAALDAAKALNPASESARVTIAIEPGTYREQLLINTPYLTFVNSNPAGGEVLLTWYYGIGYKYYSSASSGYYSAADAASKSAKGTAQRWGTSVRLQSGAKYFRAENITFENSFNRYMTDEEIADGVEPTGETLTVQRTKSLDVRAKTSTERAAALCVEADYCEFYKCSFYSSQDTLYTANPAYFRECKIQGNTDYIFGSGDVVFDACELCFGGYTDKAVGGYITAARQQELGYLFWECSITAASGMNVGAGYFGRPWRDTAHVLFYKTKLQYEGIIAAAGWTSMSGVDPSQATFREFGTTTASGGSVNTGSRTAGTVLSACDATREQYFGSWTPYYFNNTGSTVKVGTLLSGASCIVLRNAGSGLYLSREADGNLVQSTRENAEIWMLEPCGSGYYMLLGDEGNNGIMRVEGSSTENGANVTLGGESTVEGELFKFVQTASGCYEIVTKITNDASCLGISGGSAESGANVLQWECDGSANQRWIAEIEGRLISAFTVLDAEHAQNWRLMRHADNGVLVYGDREVTFAELPDELYYTESVCAACDSKYANGDLVTCIAKQDITVYIGMDTRVSPLPAWLSDWQATALTFKNSSGVDYLCYKKEFAAGDRITLGENGQSANCVQYCTFVKEREAVITATTSATTTTTTTAIAPAEFIVRGDLDCSGFAELNDAVLLAKAAAGLDVELSAEGRRNAECDGIDGINGGDLRVLLQYLAGAIDEIVL